MVNSKQKKRIPRKREPWKGVALYHLDETSEKGFRLRELMATYDIAVRTIEENQLEEATGFIAGVPGFHGGLVKQAKEVPSGEFMLVCGFSDQEISALLTCMREGNVSVGCKATVTAKNCYWPIGFLIKTVTQEHEEMVGALQQVQDAEKGENAEKVEGAE